MVTNSVQISNEPKRRSVRAFVKQFNNKPSLLILGIGSLVSIFLLGMANNVLEASYRASQFPVPFAEGQTAFDGDLIKSYYQTMIDLGTFDIYVRTQLIDFLFIGAVILTGFFIWMFVARLHQDGRFFHRAGLWMAFALPLAGLCDALENVISFFMLAAPLSFPNWIAVVYSSVAVLKFGFWMIALLWLAVSVAVLILHGVWVVVSKFFRQIA